MYTSMLMKVFPHHDPISYLTFLQIMGSIKFPEEQNAKVSPFRKTLLNRCQKEFFREKSDEDKLTQAMSELQAKSINFFSIESSLDMIKTKAYINPDSCVYLVW